jgi:hypothetical protein
MAPSAASNALPPSSSNILAALEVSLWPDATAPSGLVKDRLRFYSSGNILTQPSLRQMNLFVRRLRRLRRLQEQEHLVDFGDGVECSEAIGMLLKPYPKKICSNLRNLRNLRIKMLFPCSAF